MKDVLEAHGLVLSPRFRIFFQNLSIFFWTFIHSNFECM